MKTILTFLIGLLSLISFAQTEIKGQIKDEYGIPITAANIFIIGTYDGTTSDENGNFSFTTYISFMDGFNSSLAFLNNVSYIN